MTNNEILREALDQYVANLGGHVEQQGEDISTEDVRKLEQAEAMLDEMNAAFLSALGVTV